jgi:hypothetical protein
MFIFTKGKGGRSADVPMYVARGERAEECPVAERIRERKEEGRQNDFCTGKELPNYTWHKCSCLSFGI